MLIYIEGNIGTGKTTFLNLLKNYIEKFRDINLDARVVLEPVDEWMETRDSDGKNILEKFYSDQGRYSYIFQMNSFISRIKRIADESSKPSLLKEHTKNTADTADNSMEKLMLVERSIYTDKNCFAENCYESGTMTKLEYDVYCKWNNWLSDEFNVRPDAYIYLRCFPNVNSDRIAKRSRDGESNIPIEYLEILHNKHEKWMAKEKESIPVLTIDALEDFNDPEVMDRIVEDIYNFVK